MTQSQHTQGPWKVVDAPDAYGYTVYSVMTDDEHRYIYRGFAISDGEANANLIAAAPELLEALEDLLRDIPIAHRPIDAFKKAINATRKAKGGL